MARIRPRWVRLNSSLTCLEVSISVSAMEWPKQFSELLSQQRGSACPQEVCVGGTASTSRDLQLSKPGFAYSGCNSFSLYAPRQAGSPLTDGDVVIQTYGLPTPHLRSFRECPHSGNFQLFFPFPSPMQPLTVSTLTQPYSCQVPETPSLSQPQTPGSDSYTLASSSALLRDMPKKQTRRWSSAQDCLLELQREHCP